MQKEEEEKRHVYSIFETIKFIEPELFIAALVL